MVRLPLYAAAMLFAGLIVWLLPFVLTGWSKQQPQERDPRWRWGIALEVAAYLLLLFGQRGAVTVPSLRMAAWPCSSRSPQPALLDLLHLHRPLRLRFQLEAPVVTDTPAHPQRSLHRAPYPSTPPYSRMFLGSMAALVRHSALLRHRLLLPFLAGTGNPRRPSRPK